MRKLTPDYLIEKIEDIKVEFLIEKGIKGLIIDLDNTMTHYNSREVKKEVHDWLEKVIAKEIKVVILSNNGADRIKETIDGYPIDFVEKARKPLKKGFLRAIKKLDLPKEKVIMIGDQIFTDTLGAKRTGLEIILVDPLPGKEFWFTYFSRFLERRIKGYLIKNVTWLR